MFSRIDVGSGGWYEAAEPVHLLCRSIARSMRVAWQKQRWLTRLLLVKLTRARRMDIRTWAHALLSKLKKQWVVAVAIVGADEDDDDRSCECALLLRSTCTVV